MSGQFDNSLFSFSNFLRNQEDSCNKNVQLSEGVTKDRVENKADN